MAKMTDEEKQANRLVTNERTRAFNARRKAYNTELQAATELAKTGPGYVKAMDGMAALEDTIAARDAAVSVIDQQIAELQDQRKAVIASFEPTFATVKETRESGWAVHAVHLTKLEQAVKARYPDIVGCWSPAGWKRPDGV